MNIYSYRTPNLGENEPWKDCIFNENTQLDDYTSHTLVDFNRQPIIQQHHVTYVTGKDTSHAHHFAKMVAIAHLNGRYDNAPSINVNATAGPASVLWIDTLRGPHACASFCREMNAHITREDSRFTLICLDLLGSYRENFWELTRQVEGYIQQIRPTLVVIDDIDHLMPHSGINIAAELTKVIRDTTNHTETAFLLIGYNHLAKRASTTGDVGRMLFTAANNIFSVSTQHAVSRVRLVRSYEIVSNILDHPDSEFLFSIADDNLPHEVVNTSIRMDSASQGGTAAPLPSGFVTHTVLRDIFSEVIDPGKTISPDELTAKLTARRQQLNRIDRSRNLIAQALHLGILTKADDDTGLYILNPQSTSPVCGGAATTSTTAINN